MATQTSGQTSAQYDAQLQALHQQAQQAASSGAGAGSLLKNPLVQQQTAGQAMSIKPANPAASSVKPPLGTPAPSPIKTPTSVMGGGTGTTGGNGAIGDGGTIVPPPTPPTPPTPPPTTGAATGTASNLPSPNDFASQLSAARAEYLKTLAPNPDIQSTQAQLDAISAQQAKLTADEKVQEGNIQDQPITQTAVGGQQGRAQRQLAALQGQQAAQAVPLQAKLANYQAQREQAQKQAETALGFVTTPPTATLSAGQTIVNPVTGQTIAKSDFKPTVVGQGGTLISSGGEVLGQGAPKVYSVGPANTLIDQNGQTIAQGAMLSNGYGAMSPQTLDMAAQQYNTTGQLPTLGGGGVGALTKYQILNRAAQLASSNGDTANSLSLQKASFAAGKDALNSLTTMKGNILAFENTASSNLDQAQKLSNQVDRTGSPVVNRWLLQAKGQYAGDPQTAAFEAAVETAANEYAKVVSSASGGGTTTDSAKAQANALLSSAQSPEQFAAVVAQLKTEMKNRESGLDQQINDTQTGMLGSQGGSTGNAGQDNSSTGGFNW